MSRGRARTRPVSVNHVAGSLVPHTSGPGCIGRRAFVVPPPPPPPLPLMAPFLVTFAHRVLVDSEVEGRRRGQRWRQVPRKAFGPVRASGCASCLAACAIVSCCRRQAVHPYAQACCRQLVRHASVCPWPAFHKRADLVWDFGGALFRPETPLAHRMLLFASGTSDARSPSACSPLGRMPEWACLSRVANLLVACASSPRTGFPRPCLRGVGRHMIQRPNLGGRRHSSCPHVEDSDVVDSSGASFALVRRPRTASELDPPPPCEHADPRDSVMRCRCRCRTYLGSAMRCARVIRGIRVVPCRTFPLALG